MADSQNAKAAVENAEKAAAEIENTVTEQVEKLGAEATKTMERAGENVQSMADFGQQNLSAVVESSRLATKAMESMSAEMVAFSKRTMQESVAATKEMASAKSLQELVEKQTAFSRQTAESMMSELSKLSEMMTTASKECTQPIADRMHASVDYAKSLRA